MTPLVLVQAALLHLPIESAVIQLYVSLLHIADAYTTVRAFDQPGTRERMKWIARLIEQLGLVPALVLVKATAIVLSWLAVALLYHAGHTLPASALQLLMLGMSAVYAAVIDRNWQRAQGRPRD